MLQAQQQQQHLFALRAQQMLQQSQGLGQPPLLGTWVTYRSCILLCDVLFPPKAEPALTFCLHRSPHAMPSSFFVTDMRLTQEGYGHRTISGSMPMKQCSKACVLGCLSMHCLLLVTLHREKPLPARQMLTAFHG
jgi:hypothetical protein